MPDEPLNPYGRPYAADRADVTLSVLKFSADVPIGAGVRESLRVEMIGHETMRVTAGLLAEDLPPKVLDDVMPFTVPRFATWFDHFCATYRGRWWGWLLGLDKREIRYINESWSHRTTVKVRDRWTYPRAERIAPARDFGHVVLKSAANLSASEVRPW